MKQKKNTLNVFYDKVADVLYMSQGKPSARDETSETKDEIVVRRNPKTHEIRGFTILNFLKRSASKSSSIPLPFNVSLS